MSQSRIYHTWISMRQRCKVKTPKNKYVERGITVCNEWQNDFLSFYNWAISSGYNDSLTIERINNDEGYSPDNCKWIPMAKQQTNKSNTVYVFYNGEYYCLRELCAKMNFPYKSAHNRYRRMQKRGEPITAEKLFMPIQKNKIAKKYRRS